MPTIKLDPSRWTEYFDNFSQHLQSRLVEIEVASLDIGDQDVAEWIPLTGISYDPKDNVLMVRTEPINHMIHRPREIHIEEGPEGIHHMEVIGQEGDKQIIKFKDILKLPEAT